MRKNILKGVIGKALQKTVSNRFKQVDYKLLAEPFMLRNETDGAWRCEFWGKVIRPAITYTYMTGDQEMRKIIDDSVKDILNSRTADGCISSYPDTFQLGAWDVWGRKYAISGLIRYYELLNHDPAILDACAKALKHLMSQVGPGKKSILQCGMHTGLAASSILSATVSVWHLTGEEIFRDFAQYIISEGCSSYGNIFECCDLGIMPAALGNGKAYEMTSCFQGAAEFAMLTDDAKLKNTVIKYGSSVLENEIFITGCGGAKDIFGEYWHCGTLRQTRSDCGALGETCVTVTWMRYCSRLLQLTDDQKFADEIEKSLYNGLLGALSKDGKNWVHANPTPLTGGGCKLYADDQIKRSFGTPFGGNDCCRAQGPEGLAIALETAVTESENTVTVNLFEALDSGTLQIRGDYPLAPEAEIIFNDPENKTLRIRTPEFLSKIKVNGTCAEFKKGHYFEIVHHAGTTDIIKLEFDFSLKEIVSPDGLNFVAVKRGPLVLAQDSRSDVPDALVHENWRGRKLCDYASAGNLMTKENTLTVWFKI